MNINIKNYLGLKSILWDYRLETIEAKDAFYYYEERFGFLDEQTLTKAEKLLIADLTKKFGGGLFLTA